MKFIPFSYFGQQAFSGSWVRGETGRYSPGQDVFVDMNYPYVGDVDVPVSASGNPTVPYPYHFFQPATSKGLDTQTINFNLPYWSSQVQPNSNCSTWRLQATSNGPSDRFMNFTLCGESYQRSRNMGTAPFDFTIMAEDTPTITGFVSDTSVTKVNERGYETFNNIGSVHRAYDVQFNSKDAVIGGSNGAWFYYVDENGNIQNQFVASGSTVEVTTQNGHSLSSTNPPVGNRNLEQEMLRPHNGVVTPYPYEGQIRKYRIEQKQAVGTSFATVFYIDENGENQDVTFGTPISSSTVYATSIPCPHYAALFWLHDDSDWETYTLASSSLSSSVCTETNTNTYYLGDTGSLAIGNTIYNNVQLTDAVDSKYFATIGSEFYYFTNASGEITTVLYCDGRRDATYDIASGSVMSFANQSLTPSAGATILTASLNVEQHFVSGTFETQQTLEVNCPSTTSGSAEITYTVPSLFSPTGSFSFLSSFYHDGNPIWSIDSSYPQLIVGDFDEDPGNNYYGIVLRDNNGATIYAGNVPSVNIGSGSFNNGGWNIFQYSLDNSTTPPTCNYNINGIYSGSFNAENTTANIQEVVWNKRDGSAIIDSKLSNGSHFQVLDVALEARSTSSMDTLFTEYNRYGL